MGANFTYITKSGGCWVGLVDTASFLLKFLLLCCVVYESFTCGLLHVSLVIACLVIGMLYVCMHACMCHGSFRGLVQVVLVLKGGSCCVEVAVLRSKQGVWCCLGA